MNNPKIAKIFYAINAFICIAIGLLHTKVHFSSLVTQPVKQILDHSIMVVGQESNIWNLWQGMSLMMGFLLVIVGLLSFSIIANLPKMKAPPISTSIIIILMLTSVIYCGIHFFGPPQIYGGIFGIVIQILCLFFSLDSKNSPN